MFDQRGVKVTSARFIVDRETYAMSGITSVKTEVEQPSRAGPVFIVLAGLFMALVGFNRQEYTALIWAGFLLVAMGIVWFRLLWPKYKVVLTSASGQTRTAYEGPDRAFVDTIVGAINEAIVHRG